MKLVKWGNNTVATSKAFTSLKLVSIATQTSHLVVFLPNENGVPEMR